jgi:hypothetical protein
MSKLVNVLIITKSGIIKEFPLNHTTNEEDFYKIVGLKKQDKNFKKYSNWVIDKYCISVYAIESGRSGQENKYEFPPPIDSKLFYGNCLIVNYDGDNEETKKIKNLTKNEWIVILEKLYSGYWSVESDDENIDDIDSDNDFEEESDNESEIEESMVNNTEVYLPEINNLYLDCTSELVLEEYI